MKLSQYYFRYILCFNIELLLYTFLCLFYNLTYSFPPWWTFSPVLSFIQVPISFGTLQVMWSWVTLERVGGSRPSVCPERASSQWQVHLTGWALRSSAERGTAGKLISGKPLKSAGNENSCICKYMIAKVFTAYILIKMSEVHGKMTDLSLVTSPNI